MIRITAGSAKGTHLHTPKGDDIRPTLSRVREAIFSIVGPHIQESTVIDLFAGTGALGIEALSRGAAHVVFVDSSSEATRLIKENLKKTRFTSLATLIHKPLPKALECIKEDIDYVFCDPPYKAEPLLNTLTLLGNFSWLKTGAHIIVQTAKDLSLPDQYDRLSASKVRTYGKTKITIYEKIDKP